MFFRSSLHYGLSPPELPTRLRRVSANLVWKERSGELEVVQLLQVYARLAELEINAGERPRAGDVALPEDTVQKAKEWSKDEAEREQQREEFMGRLRAVGKEPRAALEAMGD